jgi:hypothetical protein
MSAARLRARTEAGPTESAWTSYSVSPYPRSYGVPALC